jgi:hypothetical protein
VDDDATDLSGSSNLSQNIQKWREASLQPPDHTHALWIAKLTSQFSMLGTVHEQSEVHLKSLPVLGPSILVSETEMRSPSSGASESCKRTIGGAEWSLLNNPCSSTSWMSKITEEAECKARQKGQDLIRFFSYLAIAMSNEG